MKSIFVFLLISLSQLCTAQTYHPFPDSEGCWGQYFYVYAVSVGGGPSDFQRDGYSLYEKGDTIIKSYKYSLLNYKPTWFEEDGGGNQSASSTPDTVRGITFGAIREDSTKKIWFYSFGYKPVFSWDCSDAFSNLSAGTEILLYDFNLHVGDTIPWATPNYNVPRIVSEIDSVQFSDGSYRRKFLFTENSTANMRDYWIEGMGSNYGLFGAYQMSAEADDYQLCLLNCYWVDTIPLFETSFPMNYGSCDAFQFGLTGVKKIDSSSIFSFYPNPAQDNIYLHFSSSNLKSVEVKNLLGETLITKDILLAQYSMDISSLSNGMYFIIINYNWNNQEVKKLIKI